MNDVKQLVDLLIKQGLHLVTVESCTGGALANTLTDIPGASDVFKDGFITYSNEAKIALGVSEKTISDHSVYSAEAAIAMARAGMEKSTAKPDIAVGITGSLSRIDPANSKASTVGVVYVAILYGNKVVTEKMKIPTDLSRTEAKQLIVKHTVKKLLEFCS